MEGPLRPHRELWFLMAAGQLFFVLSGFWLAVITGLNLQVRGELLFPAMGFLSLAAAAFYSGEKLYGFRRYGVAAGIFGYAVLLLFTQDAFLAGAGRLGSAVVQSMNLRYESGLQVPKASGSAMDLTVFLLDILVLCAFVLGAVIVYRTDALLLTLILLPFLAALFLVSSAPSMVALFLLLLGMLSVFASARSVRKKRLWGKRGSQRYEKNLACFQNIQKKTALVICGAALLLAVAGFYAVRPLLNVQLTKAEHMTSVVEGKCISALVDILPKISAGKWNLRVETAGGGVADGRLGAGDGYQVEGVEDLKIICQEMPEETIYLKGFVGSGYMQDRWLEASAENFTDAAANWKTDEDPGLYIQNLSFLRKLYAEQDAAEGTSQMKELTVERINASPEYTYVPYHAYLNAYYEMRAGDGGVRGQDVQDDIFSYFTRKEYQEAIAAWNKDENKKSVLDRVEASYAAFVRQNDLQVPEGFEELKAQCAGQKIKSEDVDKVTAYIKTFLSENYTYSMEAEELLPGEDFVWKFLYESKTGYSMHFASAAVLMYRMFGVPARYVVGYAAPQNLFTAQPDGTYTAVLQDDNSHAWVEIYVDREGWRPVEMTPGAVGTAEEVQYQGERVTLEGSLEEEQEDKETSPEKSSVFSAASVLKRWMNSNLEALIQGITAVLLAAAILFFGGRTIRRQIRNLGLNKRKPPRERVLDIFSACYQLLIRRGMSGQVDALSETFLQEMKKRCPSIQKEEVSLMVQLARESGFGPQKRTEEDVRFMRDIYRRMKREWRIVHNR